jgi:8-oxo-dGTP pyrophosphatase MutT (NUDIX family)
LEVPLSTSDGSQSTTANTWIPREEWIKTQPQALIASCVLVHDRRSRILLLRYGPGHPGSGQWWLPGGMLDHGEDPCTAACREMDEETGVRLARLPKLIGIDHHVDVLGTGPVLDCFFYGGTLDDSCAIRLSDEHDDHGFFDLNDLHHVVLAAHAQTLTALHAAAALGTVAYLREGQPM